MKEQDEPFRIRSRVECLYVFLDQLRQQEIQHTLDIDFWQKRIIKESNPSNLTALELDLNRYKGEKIDIQTKIRITKSMIEEDKKKLSQEELSEVLSHVKPLSRQDMVRSSIDFFIISILPHEVDYKFWQSRLIGQTHLEVKQAIEVNMLPGIKETIDLKIGGRANAEVYLKKIEKEDKTDKENNMTN